MPDSEPQAQDKAEKENVIRLIWDSPDDLDTIYVNQMVVSHAGNEFYLIFGELPMPIEFGSDSGEVPETAHIKPKVRLVITKESMGTIVEVLSGNYERSKAQSK